MPEIRVVVSGEIDRYMNTVVSKGMFGSKAELIRAALIRYFETLPLRVPSGYDDTTLFSPDGRIFQIEYALECATKGAIIVGLRYKNGVLLAKQRYLRGIPSDPLSQQILSSSWERFMIDQHIGAVPSGVASDYIVLRDKAMKKAQKYRREMGEPIGVEELVKRLGVFMQSYTMRKDTRPLGCIIFIGGIDETGCHLFSLDPSGSYSEVVWNVTGYQSEETREALKNFKSNMSLQEALGFVISAVLKNETSKPEELAVAVVEIDTKKIRKITSEEINEAWKTSFKKKTS